MHEAEDLSACDFTGLQGNQESKYIVNAMTSILNSSLPTPKMIFGNLYPSYAPNASADLDSTNKMINQLARTSSGWYPYSASLAALQRYGLSSLIVNCGETGWATDGNNTGAGASQITSVARLNMYLQAYKQYLTNPSSFPNVNSFKEMTTVFFEMFDESLKTNLPWEPYWGLYEAIVPVSGKVPSIKPNLVIPFTGTNNTNTEHSETEIEGHEVSYS